MPSCVPLGGAVVPPLVQEASCSARVRGRRESERAVASTHSNMPNFLAACLSGPASSSFVMTFRSSSCHLFFPLLFSSVLSPLSSLSSSHHFFRFSTLPPSPPHFLIPLPPSLPPSLTVVVQSSHVARIDFQSPVSHSPELQLPPARHLRKLSSASCSPCCFFSCSCRAQSARAGLRGDKLILSPVKPQPQSRSKCPRCWDSEGEL